MTGTLEGGGAVVGECGMLRVEGEEERCGGARVIFWGGVFVVCKGRHAER
jgi:hypothetical protein